MYPWPSQLPRDTCGALPIDKDAPALVAAAAGAGDGSAELGVGKAQGVVVVEAAQLQPDGGDASGGGLEQHAARDSRRRNDGDRRVSGRGQRSHRRPCGVGLERQYLLGSLDAPTTANEADVKNLRAASSEAMVGGWWNDVVERLRGGLTSCRARMG